MGYACPMSDLMATEGEGPAEQQAHPPGGQQHATPSRAAVVVVVAALGVVFGDIGTSPLYALQTVFSIDHGAVHATPTDVYGVISFVFWSITVVVSVKYVGFVLRADNDGEGGVMALAALLRRLLDDSPRRRGAIVMAVGVFGASLFYGDSVITPAISVLSAVEGLKVATPGLSHYVVPVAAVILVLLFLAQRWGTSRIGAAFGPVMLVWFLTLGAVGLREVVPHPGILRGLSPSYAVVFVADHPYKAFVAMGAIVLVITGAEALYADLGQFTASSIRRAWFAVVFPALTLNYLAQGALILRSPATRVNPFFLLVPSWAQLPLVILATIATVIASQAVISGSFSVSRQAIRLGFLPHLRIHHTSDTDTGQIYVPAVNWALFAAVLAVVIAFRSSTRLATAYGVAVTGTFLITTVLFLVVAHTEWHWSRVRVAGFAVVVGGAELTFFTANLTKISKGGWLPLTIALAVFTLMTTWQRGQQLVTVRRREAEGTLTDLVAGLSRENLERVDGTAAYLHAGRDTAPLALWLNIQHNRVLHRQVIIITAVTANVPHIPWERRITVDHLGDPNDSFVHVTAEFGFQDRTDIEAVLHHANDDNLEGAMDAEGTTFFLSRVALHPTREPGMRMWRKRLFVALARNATTQADQLHLPPDRTVTMGAELDF
jgi:KUP system potassium uptake protein